MDSCTIGAHDAEAMAALRAKLRLDPYRLRRFRHRLYLKSQAWEQCLQEIPANVRGEFARRVSDQALTLVQRQDSPDGATKLLMQALDGSRIETVILRSRHGRCSVCVSSQVGCAAGCQFCATSYLGRQRNLDVNEIIQQVVVANRLLLCEGRRVRNLVFMGMGEPFHNQQQVFRSLRVLHDREHLAMSQRRTVVSTVGVPKSLIQCAAQFRKTPLAVSLHSAIPRRREELIPVARAYPLPELRLAMAEASRLQGEPLMIEYLLLNQWNDRREDLEALADYIGDLPVLINLIPYNPIPEAPQWTATPHAVRRWFADELRRRGFTVTIRNSLGQDIAAACGQLARRQPAPAD